MLSGCDPQHDANWLETMNDLSNSQWLHVKLRMGIELGGIILVAEHAVFQVALHVM